MRIGTTVYADCRLAILPKAGRNTSGAGRTRRAAYHDGLFQYRRGTENMSTVRFSRGASRLSENKSYTPVCCMTSLSGQNDWWSRWNQDWCNYSHARFRELKSSPPVAIAHWLSTSMFRWAAWGNT